MLITLCDRCGKVTKNPAAFCVPVTKENGSYSVGGNWFGDPVILCNDCLKDFNEFRYEHPRFNSHLIGDNN